MIRKPSPFKRFKKRLWKISKWGFGFLGIALLSGYGYVRYDYLTAADDLDYQVSLARENGFHLTAEDMRPQPLVKPEENAAPIYRKAFAAITAVPKPRRGPDYLSVARAASESGEENLEAAQISVDAYSSGIELAKEASRKPRCDFERDWSDPFWTEFPEYSAFRNISILLSARSVIRARKGDVEGCISDIQALLRMVPHIEEEKVLIAALVSFSTESFGLRAIRDCSLVFSENPLVLDKFSKILSGLPETPDPITFLHGEIYFGYQTGSKLKETITRIEANQSNSGYSFGLASDYYPFGIPFVLFPPLIESDLCERAYASKSLQFWNTTFNITRQNKVTGPKLGDRLNQLSASLRGSLRPSDQLNRNLLPEFGGYSRSFTDRIFRRHTAFAYLKLLQYNNENGTFPDTLKQVAIASVEPYGNTIVKYRRTDDGFRLYGLGLNGVDNGGKFPWETSTPPADDNPIFYFPAGENVSPEKRGKAISVVRDFLSIRKRESDATNFTLR